MISLSRICFSVAAAFTVYPLAAGGVSGRIELKNSRNPSVRKSGNYSGVVVWLDPASSLSPHWNGDARAQMIQKGKRFIPHILAIPVGATVDFPNLDPIFHNAFSNFSGKIFDIGLYAPGSSRPVRFDRPGIVRIFCNIHSTMSAVIAVLDTPYFATTPASGEFSISGVPPGEYTLHFFNERSTPQALKLLDRRVNIQGDSTALGEISISESDYLPTPHKNKYGREYAPAADDRYTPGSR
ncbi:MAG TPA: carboxypeptidase regulatory-like domain-containing protein [Bryobacteraceae bacterium]|jgi:plastocyanin|nr:carboxypeptidase regulatory-like domain-containing protein [Bryobacteraceae bacterium]